MADVHASLAALDHRREPPGARRQATERDATGASGIGARLVWALVWVAAACRGGHFQRTTHTAYDTRVLKIRGPANLAGAWSAQPVPASRRPPHAAHRPAAARAPRTGASGGMRRRQK